MEQPIWNFEQEPWVDESPDETSINLRAYFDRMPDDKMQQYSADWSDGRVVEWDGNFRDDGSPAPDKRHLGSHHGHELHIGVQRQIRHIDHGLGHVPHIHAGLHHLRAVGLRTPAAMRSVISVAALPMSIWPQAMSYLRPSSEMHLVSPVMACLVAVYGAELGRGTCAEIEPLLMMRPPRGCCAFISLMASCAHRNAPVRLTATTALHCS
jgi:hypothetical protein